MSVKPVQVKDIRQGKTLWFVYAALMEVINDKGEIEVVPRMADIERAFVTSGLIVGDTYSSSEKFNYRSQYGDSSRYVSDAGIIPCWGGLNRTFVTENQAKQYIERVKNLQLTPDEWERAQRGFNYFIDDQKRNSQMDELMQSSWDDQDYQYDREDEYCDYEDA